MKKIIIISTALIVLIVVVFVVIQFQQYRQYQQQRISCRGDFSYDVQCPLGTTCQTLGQGPTAGGLCKPYLSPLFDFASDLAI